MFGQNRRNSYSNSILLSRGFFQFFQNGWPVQSQRPSARSFKVRKRRCLATPLVGCYGPSGFPGIPTGGCGDPGSSELPLRIRGVLDRSAQIMAGVKPHPLIHNLKAHSMACSYEYLMPEKCLSLLPNHQVKNNKAGRYGMPFLAHWAELYIGDPALYVKAKISTILTRPLRLTKPYCSANLAESVHHFRLGSRYDG